MKRTPKLTDQHSRRKRSLARSQSISTELSLKPYRYMVVAIGVPSYVYSDDGEEFKSEFKQKLTTSMSTWS